VRGRREKGWGEKEGEEGKCKEATMKQGGLGL